MSNYEIIKSPDARLVSFDFLRSVAIIGIIFAHLPYLVSIAILDRTNVFIGMFGNGLFVFMSGFLIYYNNKHMCERQDFYIFIKKRFFRIFPLYWIALIILPVIIVLISGNYSSVFWKDNIFDSTLNFVINCSGLQILLPIFQPTVFWFIGFIVLCYLIYPILIHFSNNYKQLFLFSVLIFMFFLFLRYTTGMVEDRFFTFYFVFITGILINYVHFFERKRENKEITFISVSFIVFLLIGLIHYFKIFEFSYENMNFLLFDIGVMSLTIITGCIILVYFVQINRITSFIERGKFCFYMIAFSSYAIYLFHMTILESINSSLKIFTMSLQNQAIVLIIIGIPLVILISYLIQLMETKTINHFIKKNVNK
jgi:peptidoglycan/LPS O-acetylase OafA/YrhL